MDLGGVVPVSLEVTLYHGLEPGPFEIRPGKSARVQEHFPNVPGEDIPVPDPEMVELVPPEEETFEVEEREEMIDPCQPLGHPGVVSVFRLEQELEETPGRCRGETSRASAKA